MNIGAGQSYFPSYFPYLGSNGLSLLSEPRAVAGSEYEITLTFANPVTDLVLGFGGLNGRMNGSVLEYEELEFSIAPSAVDTLTGNVNLVWDENLIVKSEDISSPYNTGLVKFAGTISSVTFSYQYVGVSPPGSVDGIDLNSISYVNTVPEPAAITLFGCAGLAALLRRRR